MTAIEMAKVLALINSVYQRGDKAPDELTLRTWTELFADDDAREVTAALKGLMLTSKYPPTPADLKEALVKQRALARGDLTAGEAWEKVIKAMHRWGYYQPDKAHEMLGDDIWAVIRQCGGWAVCCDSEMTVISAQFERRYNARKEQQAYAEKLPAGLIDGVRELLGLIEIKHIEG